MWKKKTEFRRMEFELELVKLEQEDGYNVRERKQEMRKLKKILVKSEENEKNGEKFEEKMMKT